MAFDINYKLFSDTFAVPRPVADALKLAKGDFAKVILCILADPKILLTPDALSNACGISSESCEDALLFWQSAGILSNPDNLEINQSPAPVLNIEKLEVFSTTPPKMTHSEYSKRLAEDEKMGFMIRKAEIYMGTSINEDKAKSLIALHDFAGLDADVILTVVAYCCSKGQKSMMAIKKEALSWAKKDVTTIEKAENHLRYLEKYDRAVSKVRLLLELPSEKDMSAAEKDASYEWIEVMGIPDDLIKEAGTRCRKRYGAIRLTAVGKCLNTWHGKGLRSLVEVDRNESTSLFPKSKSKMKYYQGFISESPSLTEADLTAKPTVPVYSRKERNK